MTDLAYDELAQIKDRVRGSCFYNEDLAPAGP
jgi:hypothetical protein